EHAFCAHDDLGIGLEVAIRREGHPVLVHRDRPRGERASKREFGVAHAVVSLQTARYDARWRAARHAILGSSSSFYRQLANSTRASCRGLFMPVRFFSVGSRVRATAMETTTIWTPT